MHDLGGPTLPGEAPHVRRLREASAQVVQQVAELHADPGGAHVEYVVGLRAMIGLLRRVAPQARSTSRVLQPQYSYDPRTPAST